MIEEKLIESDKVKILCYLETIVGENINYYKKTGFRLIYQYFCLNTNNFCALRKFNS